MVVTICRYHVMATIIRKPTSKYWFAAFRDARGRQHRKTTREIDKKRAQTVADQLERVAQRKGNPQKVRETFANFFKEFYDEELPSATVRGFVDRWLQHRK